MLQVRGTVGRRIFQQGRTRVPQSFSKRILVRNSGAPAKPPVPLPDARPPFGIRSLLVGTSVGLGTPLYATAGIVVAWHRILPKHPLIQLTCTLVIGGGVGTLVYNHVGPLLLNHSEIVLPFAAANGLASMFWYGVMEYQVGLEAMAGSFAALAGKGAANSWPLNSSVVQACFRYGVPFGGPAVGVLTVVTAGYLYPLMAKALWPEALQKMMGPPAGIGSSLEYGENSSPDFSWMVDLHHLLMMPVTIPVGIVSGYGIHALLAPVLLGSVAGGQKPWPNVALPILAALGVAGAFYFAKCGTYDATDMFWERRLDFKTGKPYSANIRNGETIPGWATVSRAEAASLGVEAFAFVRSFVDRTRENMSFWSFLDYIFASDPAGAGQDNNSLIFQEDTQLKSLPFAQISHHQQVFLLIDVLVRLKYLQMLKDQAGNAQSSKSKQLSSDKDELFYDSPLLAPQQKYSQEITKSTKTNVNQTSKDSGDRKDREYYMGPIDHQKELDQLLTQYRNLFPGVDPSSNTNSAANIEMLLKECEIILISEERSRNFHRKGDMENYEVQNAKTVKLLKDFEMHHKVLSQHLFLLRKRLQQDLDYAPLLDKQAMLNLRNAERYRFGPINWFFSLIKLPFEILGAQFSK